MVAAVLAVVLLAFLPDVGAMGTKPQANREPGRIMVQFEDGVSEERARQIVQDEGCEVVSHLENLDIYVVFVPAEVGVAKAVEGFAARPEVRYAEPDAKAQPLEGR